MLAPSVAPSRSLAGSQSALLLCSPRMPATPAHWAGAASILGEQIQWQQHPGISPGARAYVPATAHMSHTSVVSGAGIDTLSVPRNYKHGQAECAAGVRPTLLSNCAMLTCVIDRQLLV